MVAVGVWPVPVPRMAALETWPVSWAMYGLREGVVGFLGPVLPPLRRGRSP